MKRSLYAWLRVVPTIVALFVTSLAVVMIRAEPPPPPGPLGPTLDLHAGWNMISTPIGYAPLGALQGDCSVTDGPWSWNGFQNQYVKATTLQPGTGYWIKVSSTCSLKATGRRSTDATIVGLRDGWNMISSNVSWVEMNKPGGLPHGNCVLESGPWWWDGTQYQFILRDQPLDNFKGFWVEVSGDCSVTSQSVHRAKAESPWPPGPPADSASSGFVTRLITWLEGHPRTLPQARPLALQEIQLLSVHTGQVELLVRGRGIWGIELSLYNLSGQLIAEAQGAGSQLRAIILDRDGQPLANGVYLSVVTVRGFDGQVISEVRRLVLLR